MIKWLARKQKQLSRGMGLMLKDLERPRVNVVRLEGSEGHTQRT